MKIISVDLGNNRVTVGGIDLRREVIPGDTIRIENSADNNGNYEVVSVTFAVDSVVELVEPLTSANPDLGFLHELEKPWEDFFIDKDIDPVLGGIDPMPKLVEDFTIALGAIPNTPAAGGLIEIQVNAFAPRILARGRLVTSNNSRAYADDRILYWARLKMGVVLKNHQFCLSSLRERNRLVQLLESKSRGYEATFVGAPASTKKVLLVGFDPFDLNPYSAWENPYQGNPSGSSALAMHAQTLDDGGGNKAYIQSIILPVRYADLEQNGGSGVVEDVIEKFMDGVIAAEKADMIITMGQGNPFEFDVERYAARYRAGNKDSANRPAASPPAFQFPESLEGDEFITTTLPYQKIVPGSLTGKFKVYFRQNFIYEYYSSGEWKQSKLQLSDLFPTYTQYDGDQVPGTQKVEKNSHPANGLLVGKVPSKLNNVFNPKKKNISSRSGSSGDFIFNEVHYRVSRLREIHDDSQETGQISLPMIQSGPYGLTNYNPAAGLVYPNALELFLNPIQLKDLLDKLETMILDAITP